MRMTGPSRDKVSVAHESKPSASDVRRAGFLLSFAGVDFILAVMVLEAIYPGYSVHHNAVSDLLAVGTGTSLIGEPALFLAAIAWIVGAYYLYRNTGRTGVLILNLLPGTGLLVAVLSPENVNIILHSLGAVLAFIPGPFAAILSYRNVRSPFRYYALALGFVSLVGTVIYFGAYETALVQQGLGPGGWERVIVYPLLIWLIGYGSYLLARSSEGQPEAATEVHLGVGF
jgi:hypothetical membrane protein